MSHSGLELGTKRESLGIRVRLAKEAFRSQVVTTERQNMKDAHSENQEVWKHKSGPWKFTYDRAPRGSIRSLQKGDDSVYVGSRSAATNRRPPTSFAAWLQEM